LVEFLGIEFPIIQAPIGSAASPQLAAAVSNAGGLGMLALSWKDLQAVRRAIRDTRELTSLPFGANLVWQCDHYRVIRIVNIPENPLAVLIKSTSGEDAGNVSSWHS
jgi:NAD(P)H-dependent flavin oxidoreductase YrpB (nitropropane dioxygenase family)